MKRGRPRATVNGPVGQPVATVALTPATTAPDFVSFTSKLVTAARTARLADTVLQVDYVDSDSPDAEKFIGQADGVTYLAAYVL